MSIELLQTRLESYVGPLIPQSDGIAQVGLRTGKMGELLTGPAHGAFFEAASRGRCRMACNQSAITFGTALTATAVTFTLSNPAGSGILLALLHTGLTMITSTTAGSLVYGFSAAPSAIGTALTVQNALLGGGSAGAGQASAACTLPAAPVAVRTLASGFTTNANACIHDQVNGGLVIYPGYALTIQGITIVGTGLIDCLWEEIPIPQ